MLRLVVRRSLRATTTAAPLSRGSVVRALTRVASAAAAHATTTARAAAAVAWVPRAAAGCRGLATTATPTSGGVGPRPVSATPAAAKPATATAGSTTSAAAAAAGAPQLLVVGVDEAGRGALLGPLTIAAVVLHRDAEQLLFDERVRDSKTLSGPTRERLAALIRSVACETGVCTVSAAEIDAWRARGINLNDIEARAMTNLLAHLRSVGGPLPLPQPLPGQVAYPHPLPSSHAAFVRDAPGVVTTSLSPTFTLPDWHWQRRAATNEIGTDAAAAAPPRLPRVRVALDSITSNSGKFGTLMQTHLPLAMRSHTQVFAEIKADAKYVAVAAASILAKSAREAAMAVLQATAVPPGVQLGCGYPSDPLTRAFVEEGGRQQFAALAAQHAAKLGNDTAPMPYPAHIIRHSWKLSPKP